MENERKEKIANRGCHMFVKTSKIAGNPFDDVKTYLRSDSSLGICDIFSSNKREKRNEEQKRERERKSVPTNVPTIRYCFVCRGNFKLPTKTKPK